MQREGRGFRPNLSKRCVIGKITFGTAVTEVRDSREKGAGCTRDRNLAFQIQFKWTKESAKIYHHFDVRPLASKKTISSYFGRFTISTQEARGVFGHASGNSCACPILSNLPHASITRCLHAAHLPFFLFS